MRGKRGQERYALKELAGSKVGLDESVKVPWEYSYQLKKRRVRGLGCNLAAVST